MLMRRRHGTGGRVMTDYKELIDILRICAEMEWFAPNEMRTAADTIELLASDIDVVRKERDELAGISNKLKRERDRAISELRSIGDNCFCCRWWQDEPPEGDWSHNHCSCPDTCCADDNPDRWEWRGVTNE